MDGKILLKPNGKANSSKSKINKEFLVPILHPLFLQKPVQLFLITFKHRTIINRMKNTLHLPRPLVDGTRDSLPASQPSVQIFAQSKIFLGPNGLRDSSSSSILNMNIFPLIMSV